MRTEMELEVGRAYKTRCGLIAKIIKKKLTGAAFPFLGTVRKLDGKELTGEVWTKRGRHYGQKDKIDDLDIVGEFNDYGGGLRS